MRRRIKPKTLDERKPCTRATSVDVMVKTQLHELRKRQTDLDMHIEHYASIDVQTQGRLYMMRKTLLVPLLDCRPFLSEFPVLCKGEKSFELVQVLQPDRLGRFESLGYECGELRVALRYEREPQVRKLNRCSRGRMSPGQASGEE